MNALDIIVKKRDGRELTSRELEYFVAGIADGSIPDYQIAAWAMAVYFAGMTDAETTALTLAMAASGDQLDLHGCLQSDAIIVDKHSSGGVGDKTTLSVGPIVAACGLPVGKMSGRGLSHTGGTIDKLESITGWHADMSDSQFCSQLQDIGLVVAEQTADLAPADKNLYALRDVTGTVPSLPLIASSIMSKKLASGADAIVLDVKCGQGAFMKSIDQGRKLAKLMVSIGHRADRQVIALLTQMEQPLGYAIGNIVEVREAIDTLKGQGPTDFTALVESVAVEMIRIGTADTEKITVGAAEKMVRDVVTSGSAIAKFRDFVVAQGGQGDEVDHPESLPLAPIQRTVVCDADGYVQSIQPQEVGLAAVDLGGGRRKKGDKIDHSVGIVLSHKVGEAVSRGDSLATVYAADERSADAAIKRISAAISIGPEAVDQLPVVYERISFADL